MVVGGVVSFGMSVGSRSQAESGYSDASIAASAISSMAAFEASGSAA